MSTLYFYLLPSNHNNENSNNGAANLLHCIKNICGVFCCLINIQTHRSIDQIRLSGFIFLFFWLHSQYLKQRVSVNAAPYTLFLGWILLTQALHWSYEPESKMVKHFKEQMNTSSCKWKVINENKTSYFS